MKPTVSVMSTVIPFASSRRRVVGSSVAKSLSSANTSAFVNLLSNELFPAFVYPASETMGTRSAFRFCLYCSRCVRMLSIFALSNDLRSRNKRLSISICFSPIPFTAPLPLCRSR